MDGMFSGGTRSRLHGHWRHGHWWKVPNRVHGQSSMQGRGDNWMGHGFRVMSARVLPGWGRIGEAWARLRAVSSLSDDAHVRKLSDAPQRAESQWSGSGGLVGCFMP
eukprot:357606-Chlamydomonas_euryale.AAC.2